MQDDKNKLTCKICNQEFTTIKSICNHISKFHNMLSNVYYDKYFKNETEGICKICGKLTKFKNLSDGYRVYCSNKCSRQDEEIYKKAQETNIERYGNICSLANENVKKKVRNTKLSRYGNEYYANPDKSRETYENKTYLKYKNDITDSEILSYKDGIFNCKCNKCNINFNITESLTYLRHYRYKTLLCPVCNPLNTFNSNAEKEIVNYLKSLLNTMDNKLTCKICNQEFTKIDCVSRHVKRMHTLEPQQYYDKYFKTVDEGFCKCCNNETSYFNLQNGYREFCSRRCFWKYTNNLQETKDKRQQTCQQKYGVNNFMSSDEFKNKSKDTNLKLYGVENAGGSLESINKIKQTKLERYGNENWNNCHKELKESVTLEKFKILCTDIDILNYKDKIFTCKCRHCNTEFNIMYQTLCNRLFTYKTNICINCNPLNTFNSNAELSVSNYIKNNIDIIENDRSILTGHELDIYIPSKKLAIEYDGLYWHSELFKDKNYHVDKTNECEKQGIQLIHVFEDEWLYKQDIVKSRLNGLLGLNERIFARKCVVKEVSSKLASEFLNNNHIQGTCNSKYRYGLYYMDELVSLMTFGESRFKKGEFELLRFCNKLYTNVIGGASKLFKHFLVDHQDINIVISFADRRWSSGNLYETLGFDKDSITPPSYFYIIDNIRHNRINFQKHKLINAGYDQNLSEHDIMLSRKIYRIYDCGNLKYIFKR